jgi:adenosine deaminase
MRSVIERLQVLLRAELRRLGVVIELCPSSNTWISGLSDLSDLPYDGICPIDRQQRRSRGLRVSFNTDNPGLLQSSISQEVALLGDQLIQTGADPEEVHVWLREAIQTGVESTFAPAWLPRGMELVEWLAQQDLLPEGFGRT